MTDPLAVPTLNPIIVDAYEGDARKDWAALAAAGAPWSGAFLKVSQGNYYNGGLWLSGAWKLVGLAGAHANRGVDWVRGGVHYLDLRQSGTIQADYFCSVIKRAAGGFSARDLVLLDVESSDARRRASVSGNQVVDRATEFADRIRGLTGKGTVFYGGGRWLYELGVVSRLGCRYAVVSRFDADLPAAIYQRIGWSRDSLLGWHYCGLDSIGRPISRLGYPRSPPGCGASDLVAVMLPGGVEAISA